MRTARRLAMLILALVVALPAGAADVQIAAAADLKYCMDDLVATFEHGHPGADIAVSYGSSGTFAAQIRQGAPFDLFFSADIAYPRALAADGFADGAPHPYARGRIVLWSTTLDASTLTLADLARPDIRRVAIANPRHAPYGKRAEEALRASGVWAAVAPKLVFGENIAQTAQFVASGNAQVGIVALSLVVAPAAGGPRRYHLIPERLHEPLEQGFMIARHAAGNALAHEFVRYVQTPAARAILSRYGFSLPAAAQGG